MTKVKSLADLKAMREKLQSNLDVREKAEHPESLVQIKVAMATCGIAAGAKQVMEHMMQKADELHIPAVFTQTGCMGYCHAEPTLEVRVPAPLLRKLRLPGLQLLCRILLVRQARRPEVSGEQGS